jgi:hypothetical protein
MLSGIESISSSSPWGGRIRQIVVNSEYPSLLLCFFAVFAYNNISPCVRRLKLCYTIYTSYSVTVINPIARE